MPAGRELDALVAREVMGMKMNGLELPIIWEPSKMLQDAWQVVTHLQNASPPWEQFELIHDWDSRLWRVGFGSWGAGKRVEVKAETAQLAICLAALKALGS